MRRLALFAFLVFVLVISAASCARHPDVQTFPKACQDGWTFLYTDHFDDHGALAERAVCRRRAP